MAKLLYLQNKLSVLLLPELSTIVEDYVADMAFIVTQYIRACIEGSIETLETLLVKYPFPINVKSITQTLAQIAFDHGNFSMCELPYFEDCSFTTVRTVATDDRSTFDYNIDGKHMEWILKRGVDIEALIDMIKTAFKSEQSLLFKRLIEVANKDCNYNAISARLKRSVCDEVIKNRHSELLYVLDIFPHLATFIISNTYLKYPPYSDNSDKALDDPYSFLCKATYADVVTRYLLAEYYGLTIGICTVCDDMFIGNNKFCKIHGGDFEDRLLKYLDTKIGKIKMPDIHPDSKAPYNNLLYLAQSTIDENEYFYLGKKRRVDDIISPNQRAADNQNIKKVFATYCDPKTCKVSFLNEEIVAEQYRGDNFAKVLSSFSEMYHFILDFRSEPFICIGKVSMLSNIKLQELTNKEQFIVSLLGMIYRYREAVE